MRLENYWYRIKWDLKDLLEVFCIIKKMAVAWMTLPGTKSLGVWGTLKTRV